MQIFFKGRYFRNTNLLKPIRSYSKSYRRHSIVNARYLVSKWLIKRIKNKHLFRYEINFESSSNLPRSANKNSHIFDHALRVGKIINPSTWNMHVIKTPVTEDVSLIKNIRLSILKSILFFLESFCIEGKSDSVKSFVRNNLKQTLSRYGG